QPMSAVHQNTSDGSISKTQSIVSLAHNRNPPVECWTPLGLPVEPEVYRMNSGCSAPTGSGLHSEDWPFSASVKVLSRPATILHGVGVRMNTSTFLSVVQPPMSMPSSTMALSGSSLPPRI